MRRWIPVVVLLLAVPSTLFAQAQAEQAKRKPQPRLKPTVSDYAYANDSPRQVFDFFQAKSDKRFIPCFPPRASVALVLGFGR